MSNPKEELAEYLANREANGKAYTLPGLTVYKAMTPKEIIEGVRVSGLVRGRAMRTLAEAMKKAGERELALRLNQGALSIEQQFNSFLYSLHMRTPADCAAIPEFISLFLGTGFLSVSHAVTLLQAHSNGELKCFYHESSKGEIPNERLEG